MVPCRLDGANGPRSPSPPDPGTTPYIQIRSRARADAKVEIDVIDNGIGIPAEARSRVFGSFFRAHREQGYPGTGLGLAICEAAVGRHGGTISAHPAPTGTGTLITFTLPSHQDPSAATTQDTASAGTP